MDRLGKYTNGALKYTVLSLLITQLITACAQLPEYAKPRTIQINDIQDFRSNGFTYRQIEQGDFQATSLPKDVSSHAEKINAHAVIQIRLKSDSIVTVKRWPFPNQINFFGSIDHIGFEAVMLPEKSWWNPNVKPDMAGYVLRHEQVHFALTELAARKLTIDAKKWASNLLIIRDTPEQVHFELIQQIREMVDSAMKASQRQHEEFDKDTSLYFSPSWQAWWFEKTMEELEKTKPSSNK